ncbi:molybdopterin-dependent oxidoreductase [Pseudopelagicola sp. nBUS_20]|uniref:molybdopterin-dependent oxidoreductase n=1 Tax=Pseudopelagicola sp. nBUS_20 TaxID=3395317 RepID=UPI003EBEFA87
MLTFKFKRVIFAVIIGLLLPLTYTASADGTMVMPTGSVILTVSGKIKTTNSNNTAKFDIEMLRALPLVSFSTTTVWTNGRQRFTGVPLAALLDSVGTSGKTVEAWAINDYFTDFDLETLDNNVPIIAYELNGEPMSRRDKGPLWIVYPYDSSPDYQSDLIFSRSIWQLDRLVVLD